MSTTETPSTLHCWLPSGTGPSLCSGLVKLCQTTVKGTPSRTEAHSTDKHSWPVPVPLLSQWPHCSWALWEWNGSRGGVAVRLCTAAFLQWCCLQPDGLPHLLQVGLHSPLYIFVIQELWPDRTVVQKTVWYHEPGADPQRFVILAFLSAQWRCYIFPMTLLANTQVYWFWNTSVSLFLFSPCLPSRMNMCPNNCSGRGECRVGPSGGQVYCECEDSWKGEACDTPYCQTQCGSPDRGHCQNKTCVCKTGWQGEPVVLLFLLLLLWGCDWFSRLASAASILFLCKVQYQSRSRLVWWRISVPHFFYSTAELWLYGFGFSPGPDCSVPTPANSSFWGREEFTEPGLARASHKAVVDQGVMWVVGGYVFNTSDYQMVKA